MDFPRTFTDGLGREWTVEISLANARRMREAAGISIEQLAPDMSGKAKGREEAIRPVVEFLGDPLRAFAAFYALVKPVADERKLTEDQVLEGFPDDASVERMVTAIMGAVCFFSRKSPQKVAATKALMMNFERFLTETNRKIESALTKLDFGAALDAMPEIDVAAVNASIAAASKNSATASADTRVSTRKRTR